MADIEKIKLEIKAALGFIPSFFEPAMESPEILESLWHQTKTSYLENPWPSLFKEKLAALLGRYCTVPYCLLCHSSSLRPLGMKPSEILYLLQQEPLSSVQIKSKIQALPNKGLAHGEWPEPGSPLEESILFCCVAIFLNYDSLDSHAKLHTLLGKYRYDFLILFLAYNRTALAWAEAHPELSYQADERVKQNLGHLLKAEPALADFFENYQGRIREQGDRRNFWITKENQTLVNEERQLRLALEQKASEFLDLANSMPQIVWTATPDGSLDYFNDVWFDYSGTSFDDNVGAGWAAAVHPEDLPLTAERWKNALVSATIYENEFRLRSKSGEYRWHIVRAMPAFSPEGKVSKWFGTNTDVHESKLQADELAAAKTMAESANAAKSTFLANMSHEIRTPLGAIMGFAELISQPRVPREEIQNYVSVIKRNSTQLLRIIDDILDLSKVEAGKMEIESIRFSLPDVLSDLASLLGLKARENSVELEVSSITNLPVFVNSDPTRLRQILINAVGNAIKFTKKGKVQLIASYADGLLTFRISDTGHGISPEQAEKLFVPFTQADLATTRKFGGTGLGLVLTRSLCQATGGNYWLESSELGAGSTFVATMHVEVPNGRSGDTKSLHYSSSQSDGNIESISDLGGMKVLLVEDSPDNQTLISILLTKAGAKVDLATNGFEGVEKAINANYDAVLMDIQMPKMDGYEATRQLRKSGFNKPIIALTAHAMKEERIKSLESGFSYFLTKPLQKKELLELLRSIQKEFLEPVKKPLKISEKKVLIVEDDADIRELFVEVLGESGAAVHAVRNGEEALLYLKENALPQLILLDLTLPKISGEEVLAIVNQRSDRASTKIIIASGWNDLEARAKSLGADGSLRKPVLIETLLGLLEKYC